MLKIYFFYQIFHTTKIIIVFPLHQYIYNSLNKYNSRNTKKTQFSWWYLATHFFKTKQSLIGYWSVGFKVWFMVFNTTFNTISVISWQSVLFVEETGESHPHVTSHWQTLSHNVVSSKPHHERGSNSQL